MTDRAKEPGSFWADRTRTSVVHLLVLADQWPLRARPCGHCALSWTRGEGEWAADKVLMDDICSMTMGNVRRMSGPWLHSPLLRVRPPLPTPRRAPRLRPSSNRGCVQDRPQRDPEPFGEDPRERRRRGGTSRHLGLVEAIMRMRCNSPCVLTGTLGERMTRSSYTLWYVHCER